MRLSFGCVCVSALQYFCQNTDTPFGQELKTFPPQVSFPARFCCWCMFSACQSDGQLLLGFTQATRSFIFSLWLRPLVLYVFLCSDREDIWRPGMWRCTRRMMMRHVLSSAPSVYCDLIECFIMTSCQRCFSLQRLLVIVFGWNGHLTWWARPYNNAEHQYSKRRTQFLLWFGLCSRCTEFNKPKGEKSLAAWDWKWNSVTEKCCQGQVEITWTRSLNK